MWLASNSLPVPDSPINSTRASDRAAMVACSTARVNAEPSRSRIDRREGLMFTSSSMIRIRFINGQEHAKRGPAQFPFHRQDVSTEKQCAFPGDGKTEPHAAFLERDGWLEQGSPGL